MFLTLSEINPKHRNKNKNKQIKGQNYKIKLKETNRPHTHKTTKFVLYGITTHGHRDCPRVWFI